VQVLEREMSLVPFKSLVSSAYITYMGSHNEVVREQTLQNWLSAIKLSEFKFTNFLSTEQQMLTWKKEGLPADNLSRKTP